MFQRVVSIILFAIASSSTCAQPSQGSDQPPPSRKTRPTDEVAARFDVSDTRRILIYRGGQSGDDSKSAVYFHRPLFAFAINSSPLDGVPNIVFGRELVGDETLWQFKIVLSSTEMLVRSKNAVIQDPSEAQALTQRDVRFDSIRVLRWPVYSLSFVARNKLNPDFEYGRGTKLDVDEKTDTVDIVLRTPSVQPFLKDLSKDKVEFAFSGYYDNVLEQQASISIKSAANVIQQVAGALSSQQLTGAAPIFQWQRDEVVARVTRTINVVERTTQTSLLANLEVGIPDKIFDKPDSTDFTKLGNNLKSVEDYLKPLIDSETKKYARSHTTTDTHENDLKMSVAGKVLSVTPEVKDTVQTVSGTNFNLDEVSQTYKPHDIKQYRLAQGWQSAVQSYFKEIHVEAGSITGSLPLGAVDSSFTSEAAKAFIDQGQFDNRAIAIPVGVMLCFMGDGADSPAGFAWADGKTKWPAEPWVPKHLRDLPMPNMQAMIVGGTTEVPKVGVAYKGGVIKVPNTLTEQDADPQTVTGFTEGSVFDSKVLPSGSIAVRGPPRPGSGEATESWTDVPLHKTGTPTYKLAAGARAD